MALHLPGTGFGGTRTAKANPSNQRHRSHTGGRLHGILPFPVRTAGGSLGPVERHFPPAGAAGTPEGGGSGHRGTGRLLPLPPGGGRTDRTVRWQPAHRRAPILRRERAGRRHPLGISHHQAGCRRPPRHHPSLPPTPLPLVQVDFHGHQQGRADRTLPPLLPPRGRGHQRPLRGAAQLRVHRPPLGEIP